MNQEPKKAYEIWNQAGNEKGAKLGAVKDILNDTNMVGDVMSGGAQLASVFKGGGSTAERMDERGNTTHDPQVGQKALTGVGAGASIGKNFGPWGAAIGGVAGGLTGLISGLFDKKNQPTSAEKIAKNNNFLTEQSTKNLLPESAFGQSMKLRDGMSMENPGHKMVEVEADELVLRKVGNRYKKVADFVGGKSHEQGGEPYVAKEGDIIVPGKNRKATLKNIKNRNWRAVSSLVQSLPKDTDQREMREGTRYVKTYEEGTSGVSTNPPGKIPKYSKEQQDRITQAIEGIKLAYPEIDSKGLSNFLGNLHIETLQQGDVYERPWSSKRITKADKTYRSIKNNFAKWKESTGKSDSDYSKLTDKEKRSVMYFGDTDHSFAGGVGAIQLTSANYGGLEATSDNLDNLARSYGMSPDEMATKMENDYSFSAQVSADYYKKYNNVSAEDLNSMESPAEFRKLVNPWEDENNLGAYSKAGLDYWATDNAVDLVGDMTYKREPVAENVVADQEFKTPEDAFRHWYKTQNKFTTPGTDSGAKSAEARATMQNYNKNRSLMQGGGFDTIPDAEAEELYDKGEMGFFSYWGNYFGEKFNNVQSSGQDALVGGLARAVYGEENMPDNWKIDPFGVEDKGMINSLQNVILPYLDGQSVWDATDSGKVLSKFTTNAFMGEEFVGSDLDRAASFIRDMDSAQRKKFLKDMEGKLDGDNFKFARAMVDFNDEFVSKDIQAASDVDMAMLLANPKQLAVTFGKGAMGAARIATALIKQGPKGIKGLMKALKSGKVALSTIKSLAKDAKMTVSNYLTNVVSGSRFKDNEDILGMLDEVADVAKKSGDAKGFENIQGLKQWGRAVGKNFYKNLYGKSAEDLNKMAQSIQDVTGKSFDELAKMSDTDIVKLFKTTTETKLNNFKGLDKKATSAYQKYQDALDTYRQNIIKSEGANSQRLLDIDEAVKNKGEAFEALRKQDKAIDDAAKAIEEVNMDAEAMSQFFKDSGMTMDEAAEMFKGDPGVTKLIEDVRTAHTNFINEANKLDKAQDLAWAAEDAVEVANKVPVQVPKDAGQKEAFDAFADLQGQKGVALKDIANWDDFKSNFPKMYNALEKQGKITSQIKSIPKSYADIIRIAKSQDLGEFKSDFTEPELFDEAVESSSDILGTEVDGSDGVDMTEKRPEAELYDTGDPEVDESIFQEDSIVEEKEMTPGATFGQKLNYYGGIAAGVAGDVFKDVSKYGPAFYNLSRGFEDPTKTTRRTINPILQTYQDRSQPIRQEIDNATKTNMGNARNLSGGLSSNYRSNVEKAFADNIRNKTVVDAQEAGRADQIASQNRQSISQANQYNAQVNQQADMMDMKAKANQNSFMAQGLQDFANISNVSAQDKEARRRDDLLMKLYGNK